MQKDKEVINKTEPQEKKKEEAYYEDLRNEKFHWPVFDPGDEDGDLNAH